MSDRPSSKRKDSSTSRVRQHATSSSGPDPATITSESSTKWRGTSLDSVREDDESLVNLRKSGAAKSVRPRKPSNLPMERVQEEKINVEGVKNIADINSLASKLSEQKNVVAVEGNLKKKLILSYVPPPPEDVSVTKETKKKKKKSKRVKMKSRGTITAPRPLTVDSATWVPPTRTRSQSVGTNLRSSDVGVQGEVVSRRESGVMTEERRSQGITVGVGTEIIKEKEEKKRPVTVNRAVQGELFAGQKEKTRPRTVSVGVSYKPPTGTKSIGTEISRRNRTTETEKTAVDNKGCTAIPLYSDCSTNTKKIHHSSRSTHTPRPQSQSRRLSTTDLTTFRDIGTLSALPPSGRARSTNTDFKTSRHMGVCTSKTYQRDMARLGDELERMKGQRRELEKLTKQLMEDRVMAEEKLLRMVPAKRVVKRYVMSCACSSTVPARCGHQRQRQTSLVELSSSASTLSSADSCRGRPRSRVHSMIISEPEKEDQGWHVRVLTPAKLADFNDQFITRDSLYY